MNNLEIYRGDTLALELALFEEGGTIPVNLTGAKIIFTIKNSADDADIEAVLQIIVTEHSDPVNGKTGIGASAATMSAIGSGQYLYDIQLIDVDMNVTTLLFGRIIILADITKAIS